MIERQRPQHAVQQRRQIGAEQRLRTQRLDAERAVLQKHQPCGVAVEETRQEQRIDPHRKADQHAGHGAARGGAPPEQAAEKRRRELRDRRKRQQADRRELGVAERAIIEIGHHHDGEDRKAAYPQQEAAEILALARFRARRCSTSGMTMSFETITESATHSTITMAVAADRPADEHGDAEQRGIPPPSAAPARTCRCRPRRTGR